MEHSTQHSHIAYAERYQASALDVLQQRRETTAVAREIPSVHAARRQAGQAYEVLLGRFPGRNPPPAEALTTLRPLRHLPSPQLLAVSRPDLRAALSSLRAADQQVAAAVADRLPKLQLGLSYAVSGPDVGSVGDESLLRFASGLLAPVFDAGRLKAGETRRRAEARAALAELEGAMRKAVQEVLETWIREQALFEEWTLLNQETTLAREAVDQAALAYRNGAESYLVVLDNLRSLQELQREQTAFQQTLFINRARLLKALGSPWSPPQ